MMQIAPDIGGPLSPRQQDSRNLHRQDPKARIQAGDNLQNGNFPIGRVTPA
jgi:hypothetical protein